MTSFRSVVVQGLGMGCALLALSFASAGQEEPSLHPLWSIGVADGDTADLALGRDGYAGFASDALFVAGRSEAQRDWPYVHPGPHDAWAGSRAHTFAVLFTIEGAISPAACALHVDLVDAHASAPPVLEIRVNGQPVHELALGPGGGDASIYGDPTAGHPKSLGVNIPAGFLRTGDNMLEIVNAQGSWALYDALRFDAPAGMRLAPKKSYTIFRDVTAPPMLVERDGAMLQPVRMQVVHVGPEESAALCVSRERVREVTLSPGLTMLEALVPAVEAERTHEIGLIVDGEVRVQEKITLRPVRKWTMFLMHHTHLDIGFTHTQEDVEKLQMGYLDQVLDLIDATDDYPPAARFKWMPEGLWPVESWLQQADEAQRSRFVTAVREKRIGLDALYGNALTGLYSEEELFALVDYALRLRGAYGFAIDSAMISDLPGWTWGLSAVLAQCGVRYLSTGPNISHRIGHTREWDDRPVWWETPDGRDRILFWQAGRYGYAWFHGWVHPDNRLENKLTERRFFDYFAELEAKGYPYDYVQIRYNIGADNGPPDPHLSDSVKQWNEEHAWPRIVIATTSEMFHAFEERYGDELPVVRGDFTPYWEDGAASTAADTAANRRATEKLLQAQALWAMLQPGPYPDAKIYGAWRNAVLYDEHTWGAWNAISDPDSEFARTQAARKAQFAADAEVAADAVLAAATAGRRASRSDVRAVEVFNTLSWPRTALVLLPADWKTPGDHVFEKRAAQGQLRAAGVKEVVAPVRAQRLADGRLAFVARNLPPFSSRVFKIDAGSSGLPAAPLGADDTGAWNGLVRFAIDARTGALASLRREADGRELAADGGLDRYVYVPGRDPATREGVDGVRIEVVDEGPVLVTLRATAEAPGAHGLVREYRLVRDLAQLDVTNVLDKARVRGKEGVSFAFALDLASPRVWFDQPWGAVRLGPDQAEAACQNFFTVGRWVEVRGEDAGATLACVDAPLVQMGDIRTDVASPYTPEVWEETVEPSANLYSYVMNNYWETNYAASQEGPTTFRYSLLLHEPRHDAARASRFAIEACRPPVVIPVVLGDVESRPPFLLLQPAGVRVTVLKPTRDGKAVLVRLLNETGAPVQAVVHPGDPEAWRVYESDAFEARGASLERPLPLLANGIRTLRLERVE